MKTILKISILVSIVILQSVFIESSAQTFNQKQALDLIFSKKIIDTLKSEVYISKRIIPKDTLLKLWNEEIVVPINSYVIFVDDFPTASWSHPCRYIFFDPYSGNYSVLNHRFPTSSALKVMYIKVNNIKWPQLNQHNINWPDNKGCSKNAGLQTR